MIWNPHTAAVDEGDAARRPLPQGGADGRQRQLRRVHGQDPADPAATAPLPLRAARISVHEYEHGGIAVFHGTLRLVRYDAVGRRLDNAKAAA